MLLPYKLDIGCGDNPLPGYTPVDAKLGLAAYPLDAGDGTVDEIHASHVLEHFSHRQVAAVLADWVRALKSGGTLQIAVPDFAVIAHAYLDGANLPIQGYVMGGHVDEHDHHGTIFDEAVLTEAMQDAGLIAIARWASDRQDCAALPISLNLQGTKPPLEWPKVAAVLSCPRLGWNDFWGCALESLSACGIRLTKYTGAFWDQGITRAATEALKGGAEWLLTLDYDTVFTAADIRALQVAALHHPEADAIAAIQSHRTHRTPLMTIGDADGKPMQQVPMEAFQGELVRCRTAHFGLTLIRASKLMDMPKPWFWGKPDDNGEWGEGRTDPDISFWRAWEAAGNSLYTACRVPVGHIEVMVRWPGRDMAAVYQHPSEFHSGGKPEDVWR
jgi:predicted SAM-dependent methyltransferase